MAATRNIVATYRSPFKVVRQLLGEGVQESRALVFLMVACLMVFVAQTPRLARQSYLTGEDLGMLMGGTLLAWLFIAPLLLYFVAWLTFLFAKALRSGMTSYSTRLALFWALLASTPVMLLWGLTAGFVGPGIEMNGVGMLWFLVFVWFWVSGMIAAAKDG